MRTPRRGLCVPAWVGVGIGPAADVIAGMCAALRRGPRCSLLLLGRVSRRARGAVPHDRGDGVWDAWAMGVRRVLIAAVVVHVVWVFAAAPAGASERTVVMRAGPFFLGGYQTVNTAVKVPAPQRSGYLREMHAVVVDAKGRRVAQTRVMLHHVVFLNCGALCRRPDRRYCEDRRWEPFYGTGEEDQAVRLPAGYGYRIRRGDRWKMRVMLMDHRADAARVWVRYRMVIDDHGTAVQPYWISVACNRDRIFNVPGGAAAGSVVHRRVDWRVPRWGGSSRSLGTCTAAGGGSPSPSAPAATGCWRRRPRGTAGPTIRSTRSARPARALAAQRQRAHLGDRLAG